MVTVEIDGDATINNPPIPAHESDEYITVLLVPLSSLQGSLLAMAKKHGFGISNELLTFAQSSL